MDTPKTITEILESLKVWDHIIIPAEKKNSYATTITKLKRKEKEDKADNPRSFRIRVFPEDYTQYRVWRIK